jgi:hypothetical protein
MIDIFLVILYVLLVNWNIGLYTMAIEQKGKTKLGVIAINLIISLILGCISVYN